MKERYKIKKNRRTKKMDGRSTFSVFRENGLGNISTLFRSFFFIFKTELHCDNEERKDRKKETTHREKKSRGR